MKKQKPPSNVIVLKDKLKERERAQATVLDGEVLEALRTLFEHGMADGRQYVIEDPDGKWLLIFTPLAKEGA